MAQLFRPGVAGISPVSNAIGLTKTLRDDGISDAFKQFTPLGFALDKGKQLLKNGKARDTIAGRK